MKRNEKENKVERVKGNKILKKGGGELLLKSECCLVIINFTSSLVKLGSFLHCSEASNLEFSSCFHDSLGPFSNSRADQFTSTLVGFLGDNFSAFVLHQVFFGQSSDGSFFLASEDLKAGSDDATFCDDFSVFHHHSSFG